MQQTDAFCQRHREGLLALINCFFEPMAVLDSRYRIQIANDAYKKLYGHRKSPIARHCYEVTHHLSASCDTVGETCPLKSTLETGQPKKALHMHYTAGGQSHVEVKILPIKGGEDERGCFLEIYHHTPETASELEGQQLIGHSPPFNRMLELIKRVAPSESVVLLLGESGTGKELAAHTIHRTSNRSSGPFVPVECSGLTETLFESELFGHEKGAFTGAHTSRPGLLEAARGGTLFLDEVGDIPLNLQVKLLRLLETRTYRSVGSIDPRLADFRLICATHQDLKTMVAERRFRQDLYYRINAFPIELPPLRERPEDLHLLIESLLRRLNDAGRIMRVDPSALACLERYAFPGNVRELRNILERAVLLADGDVILPEHLPEACTEGGSLPNPQVRFKELIPLEELEFRYLRWAAANYRGSKAELAKRLGLSERTLYRRLARSSGRGT